MDKKKIVQIIIGIATSVAAYVILNGKYSTRWFASLSDKDLEIEREKVRQAFTSEDDLEKSVDLQNLLRRFDKVMEKRAWGDRDSSGYGFPVHSSHGWYLESDD